MEKMIGFVGENCYDMMLLLARAMHCFGYKVLLADRNIYHTLSAVIPVPDGVNPARQVAEYDGMYFTGAELKEEQIEPFDYILADFGMVLHRDMERCASMILVSGGMPHQIRRIKEFCIPKAKTRAVVIRDLLKGGQKENSEIRTFVLEYSGSKFYFLKPEYLDLKNGFLYETTFEYRLREASEQMQEVIFGLFCELCEEKEEKQFWQIIKKQERKGFW